MKTNLDCGVCGKNTLNPSASVKSILICEKCVKKIKESVKKVNIIK